ncbi:DUF1405 domain-containing protein [Paenibacillus hamazuiensis]|uniref:DUF1405 domain-containing protein n=1 Tax=Paenibacillus hamazuiensis TaxID=2936508 RepID=UPI00200BD30D|nr:DUF1405 domain-containing protein [Paenibacillus hamazuiensis]
MLGYYFSKSFLSGPKMLWGLFWVNFLGTIYGYIWYGEQLVDTYETKPLWFLPFVPDSPTASLFFTAFLAWMIWDSRGRNNRAIGPVRSFVEAFAVITSVKYGIWAVTMIVVSAVQGDVMTWKDGMLVFSHLGMAAEALLYVMFYRYGVWAAAVASVWTLLNDYMDYGQGVYPWLPRVLADDLPDIATFTVILSLVTIGLAFIMMKLRRLSV